MINMHDDDNTQARAQELEAAVADRLMEAMALLVRLQPAIQPDAAGRIAAAMKAGEVELQVRVGLAPHIRLVTIDGAGSETLLLRRLDLVPAGPSATAH